VLSRVKGRRDRYIADLEPLFNAAALRLALAAFWRGVKGKVGQSSGLMACRSSPLQWAEACDGK